MFYWEDLVTISFRTVFPLVKLNVFFSLGDTKIDLNIQFVYIIIL